MAESYMMTTLFFWGVWLLVPILIDGLTMLTSLAGMVLYRTRRRAARLEHFPLVSILVPVHNSADTLEACLRSIDSQDYPHNCLEVLLIDNGTTDHSFAIYDHLQSELGAPMNWMSVVGKGKARALNAGIHMARGDYIFNVDSDAVLAPTAVRRVVEAMEAAPDLAAATGAIQVLPPADEASAFVQLLGRCEFFEYLTAFHVGREYQTLLGNLYTLSGAFSIFRRSVLLNTTLYSQETVTEDTDITFQIYERFRAWRVGCISDAVAYVHPIESLSRLYAQRVRWQRGQIEVSARHKALMRRPMWRLRGFTPARSLMIDHTLAFPRLVWTMLLPILSVFGYPTGLIATAGILLYLFYLAIDSIWTVVACAGVDAAARRRLASDLWILPLLPLYRMGIFWFRLSGFLHAVAEPGAWRVQDPVAQTGAGLHDLANRAGARMQRGP
jgi:putative glycosyltransferase (exosortase G-associated)